WDEWQISRWRIFLDSPMAAKVVAVYDRHRTLFDEEAREVWKRRPNPFTLPNLHLTDSTEASMAINRIENGAIVIAGSGMANGGRILHHFRHNIERRATHAVFVGYQAEGTLGRRLVDGAATVPIHGEEYRVNARIHTIGGQSAHTDQSGLLAWYGHLEGHPPGVPAPGRRRVDGAATVRIHGEEYRVNARIHTIGGLSAHTGQSGLLAWYGHYEGTPPVVLVHGEDRAREPVARELRRRGAGEVTLAR